MTLLEFAFAMLAVAPFIVLVSFAIAAHNAREWQKGYEEHMRRMDAIRERKNK